MLRFYTLPPNSISWPYVLINLNKPEVGLAYIRRHRKRIKAVLIDSGIEIFRNPRITEYPRGAKGQIKYAVRIYEKAKALGIPEVWVTVPDYCDDYWPRNLWLSPEKTNIERTVDNILWAIDNYPEVSWLIPVQGWNRQPKSIIRAIDLLEQAGVVKQFDYFAVANLCVEPSDRIIKETLRIARKLLPTKKLHSFGLKITSIAKSAFLIDSTDSTAWTRPCGIATKLYLRPLGRKNASRKNEKDSVVYFWAWIYTLTNKYKVQLEGVSTQEAEEKFRAALEWALGEKIKVRKRVNLLDFIGV